MTTERDLGDVSGEFFEEPHCSDNPPCSDVAAGVVCSELEGDMEVDEMVDEAGIAEGFVAGSSDWQSQTSDSGHSDNEVNETFSL